jgi:hypothetical protein
MADSYEDFQDRIFNEIEERYTVEIRAKINLAKSLGVDPAVLLRLISAGASGDEVLEALEAEIARVKQMRSRPVR